MPKRTCFISLILVVFSIQVHAIQIGDFTLKKSASGDTIKVDSIINSAFTIVGQDNEKALRIADWGIEAGDRMGHSGVKALALLLKGRVYRTQSLYDKAVYQFLLALNIYEQKQDYLHMASASNSIAIIYFDLKQYKKSLLYGLQALDNLYRINPPVYEKLTIASNLVGASYYELDNKIQAEYYFRQAYHSLRLLANSDPHSLVITLNNLAKINLYKGEFDQAVQTGKRSYELACRLRDTSVMTQALYMVSKAYLSKGDIRKASAYIRITEDLMSHSDDDQIPVWFFTLKYDYYKRTGDYKNAVEMLERYQIIQDSILKTEMFRQVHELENKYQVEKKNAAYNFLKKQSTLKDALLKAEIKTKRRYILLSVLTIFGLVFATVILIQKSRLVKQLAELNTEKNAVMSILSHDLRMPFTKLHTLNQILKTENRQAQLDQYFIRIHEIIKDGTELIQNLLDISSIEQQNVKLKWEEIDILDTLQFITEEYKGIAARKKINMTLHVNTSELILLTDYSCFKRIMDNLLSNALKYSEINTTVLITAEEAEGGVKISVADEGLGMDEEDKKRLFNKFSVTKTEPTLGEPSTGMGLYIVKILSALLEATVIVESTKGEGSTFSVLFPNKKARETGPGLE